MLDDFWGSAPFETHLAEAPHLHLYNEPATQRLSES
jgi:hypothetical protein